MQNAYEPDVLNACSALLLSVADADEILEADELDTIRDILIDYFQLMPEAADQSMEKGRELLKASTGLFAVGDLLNKSFGQGEKLEFIKCVFEVGYSDGELHYLEHHTIKKIANILNVEQADLVQAKIEVAEWFEE